MYLFVVMHKVFLVSFWLLVHHDSLLVAGPPLGFNEQHSTHDNGEGQYNGKERDERNERITGFQRVSETDDEGESRREI